MNKKRILCLVLAFLTILLGIVMFVYGEYDDSPGGQLIGVIVVIIGIVGLIKSKKKTSD
ncbi:MAG: hypothetical protein ABIG60_02430 [Patescibacteria group bacterium]